MSSEKVIDPEMGLPVSLRGRTVRVYPLSWAALRRTREARAIIFGGKVSPLTEAWEEAVFEVLFESVTAQGERITRDEFAGMLTQTNQRECFRTLTLVSTANRAPTAEVVDDGKEHPTSSLNGINSTPSSSPAPDGVGPTVTN